MNGETYTLEQRLIDLEARVTALENREPHPPETSLSIVDGSVPLGGDEILLPRKIRVIAGEGAEIDLVVLAQLVTTERMRLEPAGLAHEVTDRLRDCRQGSSARKSQFELADSTRPLVE